MKSFHFLSAAILTSISLSCGTNPASSELKGEEKIYCKGWVKLDNGKDFNFDSKANDYKSAANKGAFECQAKAKLFFTDAKICNIFKMDVASESKNGTFPFGKAKIGWTCT